MIETMTQLLGQTCKILVDMIMPQRPGGTRRRTGLTGHVQPTMFHLETILLSRVYGMCTKTATPARIGESQAVVMLSPVSSDEDKSAKFMPAKKVVMVPTLWRIRHLPQ